MATTAVTLDGFPLIGITPGGGRAKLTGAGLDGWLSGPVDRKRSARSSGHGAWSSRARRTEKTITATGQIVYSSPADAAAERRQLLALGSHSPTVQLIVTDSLGTIGMDVEVDDVQAPPVRDTMLRFTFRLTAPNAFARSTTAVTVPVGAGQTMSHTAAGDAPAEIEVTTTSAGTVDLTIGGLRLRWGSMPSGSVLTSGDGFPNPKRTARGPDGADLFGLIVQPMQWPAMADGPNTLVNNGTASVSVRYFPTYP